MRGNGKWIVAALALFAVFTLLWISTDSYTHDVFNKSDSAWFFMCGKAWMNGLLPYHDFSDSKGPLLWLIYGIGYLFSRTDYIGVFWLSCAAYTATFYITYCIASLFLSRRRALLASVIMALAYLNPIVHNEVRCEDFCLPLVLLSWWHVLRPRWNVSGWVIGASIGGVLLMKYNIAAMMAVYALQLMVAAWRQQQRTWRVLAQGMAGFSFVVLPFVAYFALIGCLSDFLREYFWLTFETTNRLSPWGAIGETLTHPAHFLVLGGGLIGSWLMGKRMSSHGWFPMSAFLMFYVLSMVNAKPYYLSICTPFTMGLAVEVVDRFTAYRSGEISLRKVVAWALVVCGVVCLTNIYVHDLRHTDSGSFFTQDNVCREEYYRYEYMLRQVPHAKVVSIGGWVGLGVCSEALPACRYWAQQSGATAEMDSVLLDACRRQEADFAVVSLDVPDTLAMIERWGYHRYDASTEMFPIVLLSRHALKYPPAGFHVTNREVLLKHINGLE